MKMDLHAGEGQKKSISSTCTSDLTPSHFPPSTFHFKMLLTRRFNIGLHLLLSHSCGGVLKSGPGTCGTPCHILILAFEDATMDFFIIHKASSLAAISIFLSSLLTTKLLAKNHSSFSELPLTPPRKKPYQAPTQSHHASKASQQAHGPESRTPSTKASDDV